MLGNDLYGDTIVNNLSLLLGSIIVWSDEFGETKVSGQEDLLTAWELEFCSSQGFFGEFNMLSIYTHWHEDLTDCDSCRFTKSFTKSTSHSLLKSICSSTWKHFVDSNDVPWMDSHSHVEVFFSDVDSHVLVACNSWCFKSFWSNLFLFVANKMDTWVEYIMLGLLLTYFIDSQFWIRYTSIESWFRIRLILLISITPTWSSSHLIRKIILIII